jgi:hypothetical protein
MAKGGEGDTVSAKVSRPTCFCIQFQQVGEASDSLPSNDGRRFTDSLVSMESLVLRSSGDLVGRNSGVRSVGCSGLLSTVLLVKMLSTAVQIPVKAPVVCITQEQDLSENPARM